MFKGVSAKECGRIRFLLIVALLGCLFWLAVVFFRQPTPNGGGASVSTNMREVSDSPADAPRTLKADAARTYFEQTSDGESLMKVIEKERFGLKWHERSPHKSPAKARLAKEDGGYLGLSHDENLNAWFTEEGVTIRPTLPEKDRANAWRLDMTLKSYGYGRQLTAAPPVTSRNVKDNRIEYVRSNGQLPIANSRIENWKSLSARRQSETARQQSLTEWYVNKSGGIEQGFTLNERPVRETAVPEDKSLFLVVAVRGDLSARATNDGQSIEFILNGQSVLIYSHLIATDATGKKLPARMEANAPGNEITLAVEDAGAQYPIVIDPITATLEKKLDAEIQTQAEARFGFAVALDGDRAVVGAWREDDSASKPDTGAVYSFTRSGSSWSRNIRVTRTVAGAQCGWSVAVSGNRFALGCPGFDSGVGTAFLFNTDTGVDEEIVQSPGARNTGNLFGSSVAISGDNLVVGSPSYDTNNGASGPANVGLAHLYRINSSGTPTLTSTLFPQMGNRNANAQFGTDVAINGNTVVVGGPGVGVGYAEVWQADPFASFMATLLPNDGASGDSFGNSVAVSGNAIVVGAPTDDNERGTDAGAAYVFVRDGNGTWTQQQKIMSSDGRAGDLFGEHALAIEGNMMVIGAYAHDLDNQTPPFSFTEDRGAVYFFSRNINTWTQQNEIQLSTLGGGESSAHFGIDIDISFDTVIVGARAATGGSTTRAGAAYVYRLNCVPPSRNAAVVTGSSAGATSLTECPGRAVVFDRITLSSETPGPVSFQWRKNGVSIPGATANRFSIASVNASDVGSYDVIVTNACGSEISTPATLGIHSFSINPRSQNFSASGSTGIVNVTSTGTCGWTATSNASWITITSGASGTGNGTVGFTVAANAGAQRNGAVTIAGQSFTVTQDGATPIPTPTPTPTPTPSPSPTASPSPTPTPATNVVQFSSSIYNVQEDCTTVTITVNRVGDTSGAASVDYNTSNVSATERKDYITALGTLRFAAGETSKSFDVLINEDSLLEGNETFSITLSNPSGLSLGGPSIATITITDDAAEPAANPIDDAQNYVCQHYHDFLNRQPDAPGLQFWTNQITACGSDLGCIEVRHINVSASFFLSIEFQDTGYLVERIYKAAYSDATGNSTFPSAHQLAVPVVRLNEFLSDTQEIGQGVIVGQGNWQQQIENNKQAFTATFVQRSRFLAAFPTSMTAAQFVDTLNANAGNPLSSSERNQLVNDLSTGAKTRAQVLRAVAEDTDLNNAESNRAFVLMQYFGYLRRNPNDPQDSDHTGYDFWLTKLNQFNGNYNSAEMVKAFITSIEYRQRFGP